jgi:hypothetical protein
MPCDPRSAFQQQVVEALVQSKAINLEAVGAVISKYAERALLTGESIASIVNQHNVWICGNPGPILDGRRLAQSGME